MSFQAYIDTIQAKTGLGPADFLKLATDKGLIDDKITPGPIIAWLADEYGLGRGHAMALVATFRGGKPGDDIAGGVDKIFSGAKQKWRPTYDTLLAECEKFGPVDLGVTSGYVSLLKGKAKFAIVAATSDRLDLGIKLKSAEPTDRFEASGNWNSMVTHRVRLTDPSQLDAEVLDWLKKAYDAA